MIIWGKWANKVRASTVLHTVVLWFSYGSGGLVALRKVVDYYRSHHIKTGSFKSR